MSDINKIFGIGMSRTGTTTLARCFKILGLGPHKCFDGELKEWVAAGSDLKRVFAVADNYKTFEDNPWYILYKELDERYPGSKFILTVRRDSLTHAKSSWTHGVQQGVRRGKPTEEYINEKIHVYEAHNQGVMEYFRDRPKDLLVVCWEKGDGWDKLCGFLGLADPNAPIPHMNAGRYRNSSEVLQKVRDSWAYMACLRLKSFLVQIPAYRKIKQQVHDRFIARSR